jgi:hypothetical protein
MGHGGVGSVAALQADAYGAQDARKEGGAYPGRQTLALWVSDSTR